jgi:uncharacterized HAD superfamily protein
MFDLGFLLPYIETMIVGMDVDGVVADFLPAFIRLLEKKTGNSIITETITDLTFKGHDFVTDQILEDCMAAVSQDPEFWSILPSLLAPSEWEALDDLSRRDELVFITHRYQRETYDINQVTCDWLRKQGVSKPVVHFTQQYKSEVVERLGVKLFVDDRHENCLDVAEKTQATVIMPHRHYNQSFIHPRVKRIKNFNELLGYLR